MLYKLETSYGNILIDKAVIGKILAEAIATFQGKVLLSSPKGKSPGLVAKIGGNDDLSHVDLEMGENGLDIRLYVTIKFGTSINMVTKKLIADIKNNMEEYLELKIKSVSLIVAGMVSKQIARRNIEVKG